MDTCAWWWGGAPSCIKMMLRSQAKFEQQEETVTEEDGIRFSSDIIEEKIGPTIPWRPIAAQTLTYGKNSRMEEIIS